MGTGDRSRRQVRWMWGLGCATSFLLLLVVPAWLASGQPGSVLLSVELPDRPTAGARLFAQKGCAHCHSIGGDAGRIGPDLGGLPVSGTVLDLAGSFWNHAPVMRLKMQELDIPHPTLDGGEVADIVALLTSYRYYLTEIDESGDASRGREVFVAKRCAECHGEDQSRWGQLGPGLQKYRGRASGIFLAQAMWNHEPRMASLMPRRDVAWPTFTGGEMADLIAYFRAGLAGTAREPRYFQSGSPRRGRAVFERKRCTACHAVAGVGGQGGPDLGTGLPELVRSVPEIAGLMWNHGVRMSDEFRRRRIPWATFSGQEMIDVIAYLYFVNYATVRGTPSRGERLFAGKCSACHGPGSIGPDLTAVPDLDGPFAVIAAMWNHASQMEEEAQKRGLAWPRFDPGEAADLAAFLLARRATR